MSRPLLNYVLAKTIEALDQKSRGERILNPALYSLASGSDKLFLCEVVSVSDPDLMPGGHTEVMCARPGDVAMLLENKISYRLTMKGERRYLIRNAAISGLLNPETFEVTPVNHYVLVKPNEERAIAFESREGLPGADGKRRMIWLDTDQVSTDDEKEGKLRRAGLVASYGEVVSCGPGRWEEGRWLEPRCKKGDLVFFDASHSTLPFTIKGKPHTLVPCDQIGLVADEAPA